MTPVNKYLQFGRRILVKILKHNELSRIKMPSHNKLEEYRQMIHLRHPVLDNVWGSMDGLKVPIEQPSDSLVQTQFYNGWKCDNYVTAALCFVPDGTIPGAFTMSVEYVMLVKWPTGAIFRTRLKSIS